VKLTKQYTNTMSIRKVTTSEIQAVGAILQDKDAIELLKKINDEIVTEEDTKGKRKQNDIFQFIGFAHQDDILGEDPESKEFQEKQGSIKNLVDSGLILEGFHVPLERKNEKKFGDVHLPATQDKVAKYKLTEEGLAVLALVGASEQKQQRQDQEVKKNDIQKESAPQKISPAQEQQQEQPPLTKKEKAIAAFKEEIKEENKL
jgi:hypothetical protein